MEEQKNRRRGDALEAAILQAAWEELTELGYNRLTIEGVAARACTNKAVVYRRWTNKAQLVSASLRKHIPKPTSGVPDTGNLRADVLMLLRGIAAMLQTVGAETIHGLMSERSLNDIALLSPKTISRADDSKLTTTMTAILKNAEQRGEINLEKISPRIISLPFDLLRYEILTTQEPTSDQTINEIVDTIFMPLVSKVEKKPRRGD